MQKGLYASVWHTQTAKGASIMPFKSKAQQRWGHSPSGQKALGGPDVVSEWDQSTDFGSLPEKAEGVLSKALKRKPSAPGVLGKKFKSK